MAFWQPALQEGCCSLARWSQGVPCAQWQLGKGPGTASAETGFWSLCVPGCSTCVLLVTAAYPRCMSVHPLPPPLPWPRRTTGRASSGTDWLSGADFALDCWLQGWWQEEGTGPVLGPAGLQGKMTGEAGASTQIFILACSLLPLLIYRDCLPSQKWPTLQVCTCTSTASSGLKSTAITVVSYRCQVPRVGGNLKQSTWKRPPLHLYSAPIILVPPLPASRLLRGPPTLHYQLPKASLPCPALAFVSVTTLALAIYTLRALCQILLRAGGTLQLKTEASAALDQSTYFKGVAMECKTWKEREKPNTAFVIHWAKVCANVAQGSLRSVRLFVILCLQGRTFPSCCTRAWARWSTSGSCGRVGDWHLLSKREGIPLPPRQIRLWMWMDTDTALGTEAAICSVWADPISAVFTVRSHSNKRKSEWMKGECHV